MSEANKDNSPVAFSTADAKRKRGRPRKFPRADFDMIANTPVPPRFVSANGNQPHEAAQLNSANNVGIGRQVKCVVEAAFDAGYLLSVKLDDCDTMLRGVVFKPGHFIPVGAGNDIAPNVPVIRRNEVSLPVRSRSKPREKNPHSSKVVSKVQQVPPSRGNVVPVVLQPVNLSYRTPEALKDKQVINAGMAVPTDSALHQHNSTAEEASAMKLSGDGMLFQNLLTEVIKRGQVASSLSSETNSSSAFTSSGKDSGRSMEDVSDTDQPLSAEPLQTVQPDVNNQPVAVSRPVASYAVGRMTELLQAVQENIAENRTTQADEHAASSLLKPSE